MTSTLCDWLPTLMSWDTVATFLNSNFTSSLSGALAGAFAGALAAQRIADRSKQRDALLSEIRSTNAAIMVAFTICNGGLALKRQLVKDIYERYNAQKAALAAFRRRKASGEIPAGVPFDSHIDLRTIQMPEVPIDVLRTLMYESISTTGRPLALTAALSGSLATLRDVIGKRTSVIDHIRSLGDGHPHIPALYYGEPYGPGHVSTEFPDTVESMFSQTDDVIFFSELLTSDLTAHGQALLAQYKTFVKASKERISSVDFTDVRNLGLMPDPLTIRIGCGGSPMRPNQRFQPSSPLRGLPAEARRWAPS